MMPFRGGRLRDLEKAQKIISLGCGPGVTWQKRV